MEYNKTTGGQAFFTLLINGKITESKIPAAFREEVKNRLQEKEAEK